MTKLDKTWVNCLKMWRWISENLPEYFNGLRPWEEDSVIEDMKKHWLKKNRFRKEIYQNCFFCQYDKQRLDDCESCPARLVDSTFHCADRGFNYCHNPIEFYHRIVMLDAKRTDKAWGRGVGFGLINTRLIAAAPDLLRACKCLLADLEGSTELLVWDDIPEYIELSIAEGKAAIAKAENQ